VPDPSDVRLNEVLPVPGEADWDGDGTADEHDEWIELNNAGSSAVELGGWFVGQAGADEDWRYALRKNATPGVLYEMPSDCTLEPGQFLVLYRGKTGIALEDTGDQVVLISPQGHLVDAVRFGEMEIDASFSRGAGEDWYVGLPTPGEVNTSPVRKSVL